METASWPAPTPNNGMGRTKISKLLAAKRPRLVPIFDSVLERLFPPVTNYWRAFEQYALRPEPLSEAGLRSGCGVSGPSISYPHCLERDGGRACARADATRVLGEDGERVAPAEL